MTLKDAAENAGVTRATVYRWLKEDGMEIGDLRDRDGNLSERGEAWINDRASSRVVSQKDAARVSSEEDTTRVRELQDEIDRLNAALSAQKQANEILSVQLTAAQEKVALMQEAMHILKLTAEQPPRLMEPEKEEKKKKKHKKKHHN